MEFGLAGYTDHGAASDLDDLIASDGGNIIGKKFTLDAGVIKRGELIGQITSGGKVIASLSGAGDGSQTPIGIAEHDADASAGDVELMVYVRGNFNSRRVIYGASHTYASVYEGLRDKGIYLEVPVARYP